ncbi:MAG: hypothetical protein LBH32_08955 [Dysgonamonadaceae bacterium]|jgi:hypothetical protein|nr:hypothetical protein [Dysgonamonadaceae bacterium]
MGAFTQYEPLDEYKNVYKAQHEKNVSEHFENLVRQSAVDETENRKTVKQIDQKKQEIAKFDKVNRRKKTLRGLLIFVIVIACIAISYCIYEYFVENFYTDLTIGISGSSVVIIVVFLLLIFKNLNPKIRTLTQILEKLNKTLNELINRAYAQLEPLFALFNRQISSRLMEKTYQLIQLDDFFEIRRYDYLNRKFGLPDSNENPNESTFFVQSGEINGNPFCFFKTLNHFMGNKTYEGTKTIYWTEHYTDANGKRRSRSRSETLHAYVTKPFPEYYYNTYLVYGNEAAPNLIFSRKPSFAGEYDDERKLEKKVKHEIKDLESEMRKRVKRGENFTVMGNGEFDVLFGATDRNHETEFRLLFTPVAQREMLKLIKDKTISWGDDFLFKKHKMVNFIAPAHLKSFDISGNPQHYTHYDIDTVRRQFNDYNNLYFKQLYFSFAPFLAIPLYQQHKPHEFIYRDVYNSNLCGYEHECEVNRRDVSLFAHRHSVTRNILKTAVRSHDSENDNISVSAYGFRSERRTDYVSVFGGDGRYHNVPVHWDEYISVCNTINYSINVEEARN